MSRKVALIVNPRSHLVARKGARLEAVARQRPQTPLVHFGGTDRFDADMRDLLERGHDTFFVEGGDGTVLAVLSSCYNHAPDNLGRLRFGVLPGGSTNLAHEKLGLKTADTDRVEALAKQFEEGRGAGIETAGQKALIIEAEGHTRAQAGFVLSTGSLALGMDHVQQHMFGGGRRGGGAVALSMLKLAARPRSYVAADGARLLRPHRLSADMAGAEAAQSQYAFTLASTFGSLSLGVSPFWGKGQGAIHFTTAPWPPHRLRRAILRSALRHNRKSLERSGYQSFNTDALSMRLDGPVMLDGEMLQRNETASLHLKASDEIQWLR